MRDTGPSSFFLLAAGVTKATLRPPTAGDYATIATWVGDAAAALRWAGPRLPFPFVAADLPALLAVPGGGESSYCLFTEESAGICGFGQHWVLQPGSVHLGRLIVAPKARGVGLGRVLCEQLVAAALQATDASAVTLRAYRDNVAAVGLYSSLGFAELATESSADLIFMRMPASAQLRPHRPRS